MILTESYGAFESTGYSCSETDVHDCKQTLSYGLKVCNTGSTDEAIYDWFLKSKDTETNTEEFCDLLEEVNPEDVMLAPGECYYDTKAFEVNRCVDSNYCVDLSANATNPFTGIPKDCQSTDETKFGWKGIPPIPATLFPRYVFLIEYINRVRMFLFLLLTIFFVLLFSLPALCPVPLLHRLLLLRVSLILNSRVAPYTTFPLIMTVKAVQWKSLSDT